MANSRGWAWISDEGPSEEQADLIEPTLNALAAEWSQIHNAIEQEGWRNEARRDEGDYGPEEPECEHCDRGHIGHFGVLSNRFFCICCHSYRRDPQLVLLTCPWCKGSGVDEEAIAAEKKLTRQHEADRQVRVDIIEAMLEHYGARMMRPYEHWNEDERYMEYAERER